MIGCALIALIVGSVAMVDDATSATPPSNPLSSPDFFVNPESAANKAIRDHPTDRDRLAFLGDTPQFQWFTENDDVASLKSYVAAAQTAHERALVTLYAIPHRDCKGFSSGGFASGTLYDEWIREVATAIGSSSTAVIVEPDALTAMDCLSTAQQTERLDLLRSAAVTLSALPNTAVYLDGGHSQWLSPAELASRLTDAGVAHARGFSLNVSNFHWTRDEVAFGEQVARILGGKHYIVDTSRNGSGPAPAEPLNWCNPSGRSAGPTPTTATDGEHADAYVWVKNPGQSDGTCDRDDPYSGLWFNSWALDFIRRSGR